MCVCYFVCEFVVCLLLKQISILNLMMVDCRSSWKVMERSQNKFVQMTEIPSEDGSKSSNIH